MTDRPSTPVRAVCPALAVVLVLLGAGVLAGCTAAVPGAAGPAGGDTDGTADGAAVPAAPPAACLLDPAALGTATGLTWTADPVVARDGRCVYDPGPDTEPGAFVAVDLTPRTGRGGGAEGGAAEGGAAELDAVATACAPGSREPAGGAGFVCRFRDTPGALFGVAVREGDVVTVAASAVPPGTTPARLTDGIRAEIARLVP